MFFYWLQLWAIDDEVVAKLAEVDMIIADLDRANSRIAALEHRNVGFTFSVLLLVGNHNSHIGNSASRNRNYT